MTPDRSCWIDPFNDARGDLKTRFGITTPVFDGRWLAAKDPNGALAYLKAARAKFGGAGVYLCSQGDGWPAASSTKPETWATKATTGSCLRPASPTFRAQPAALPTRLAAKTRLVTAGGGRYDHR